MLQCHSVTMLRYYHATMWQCCNVTMVSCYPMARKFLSLALSHPVINIDQNELYCPRNNFHLSNLSFEHSRSSIRIHAGTIFWKIKSRWHISNIHGGASNHSNPHAQRLPDLCSCRLIWVGVWNRSVHLSDSKRAGQALRVRENFAVPRAKVRETVYNWC
jgi:hypothetical protein